MSTPTAKGIKLADGSIVKYEYSELANVVTDKQLTEENVAADGKAVGDVINSIKQDLLALEQEGYPMASIQEAVDVWADDHEAEIVNAYVTPEMYGAKGDGTTDDTQAIQDTIDNSRTIYFREGKTYKVTSISIPDDKYIFGNGATIKGNGSGSLVVVQTYTSSQIHTTLPTLVEDLIFENADILLEVNKAIKCTFKNITFKNFNTGVKFVSGYEDLFENFRFEGNPSNTSAIALDVVGGGDSIFKTFLGRDVATVLQVKTGNNMFVDFHFWILTNALYNYSTFIKDVTNSDSINQYIRFYFDTYKTLFDINGWARSLFESPIVFMNSNLVQEECLLVKLTNTSFKDYIANRLKIENIVFKTTASTLCNICDDTTAQINMTYYAVSSDQYAKISACKVKSFDKAIEKISLSDAFTFETGYTGKTGSIYVDEYNNMIWGDIVISCASALTAGSQIKVATPKYAPMSALNSGCFLSDSEWGTNDVGYLYISSAGVGIKANNSGKTFIKLSFNYQYN